MTLKIERASRQNLVFFTLSGRLDAEHVAALQKLLDNEADSHQIILDLNEVKLVEQDAVRFLRRCEDEGKMLRNCPAYIREWILRDRSGK